ncbi:protein arv1-like protein isoform X2 [Iris pallida]|uniref:Protein ARV n=1 Tax=Iris pallida TaxID=29817 RepID=A0AAX6EEW7_IRIPA|nr:protein arv1-like protein isoform X2 [Iris pallida]
MNLQCVNCGHDIGKLFVQYSPGNIRLMKCENCNAVADPYIECEFMILLIDLILHKTKAYRHLLYNMFSLEVNNIKGMMWKFNLAYIFLDAYMISVLRTSKDDWDSSGSLLLPVLTCLKVLIDVLLGNFIAVSVVLVGTKVLLTSTFNIMRYKEILLALLISSYFKLFLIATMVWEFPSSVFFIIDVFVLSSNAVALRVMTRLRTSRCVAVCFAAHSAKFLLTHFLMPLFSISF